MDRLYEGMTACAVGRGHLCTMQLERRVPDRFSLALLKTYNPQPMQPTHLKCPTAPGELLRLAHVISAQPEHPR